MDFEEILDHTVAMLQRRRRVAYRTLQVQFNLDDSALEALKDELIYSQKLAVDEAGRVLVWTGDAVMAPAVAAALAGAAAPAPTRRQACGKRLAKCQPLSISGREPQ
jgi:hypothetical protein